MKKFLIALLLLTLVLFGLAGCLEIENETTTEAGSDTDEGTTATASSHTVTLTTDASFVLTGEAAKEVEVGGSAVFTVTPAAGYKIIGASAGTYDKTAGTLTISGITSDMTVTLMTAPLDNVTVTLTPDASFVITGDAIKTTVAGGEVTFSVAPAAGYQIISASAGIYNKDEGTLTVSAVTADMTVALTTATLDSFIVTLTPDASFVITGDSVKAVSEGGSVVFYVSPAEGYQITAASVGSYSKSNGTLTVSNVTENTTVILTTSELPRYNVTLYGSNFTVTEGTMVQSVYKGGSAVFHIAPAAYYGISTTSRGTYDPETGTLTIPNITYAMTVNVTTEPYTIHYHANGGSTGDGTVQSPTFELYTAPNTKWDDGTFVRDGYALIEYNTKADGSGTAYSLGSKVTFDKNAVLDLYCIWAKETPTSDFTFSSSTVKITTGNTSSTGYAITKYNGSAATVVIPTKYNGKPVVQINAGAFSNETQITTLVLTKNLRKVIEGAFAGCSNLNTLYFSDSIYTIPDTAFDSATYSNLHHFYLNATMAPRYTQYYEGQFRIKWDRIVTSDKPCVVVLSGSSSLFGLSSTYFEKLLDGNYTVVEYGTTRTTCMMLYMESFAFVLGEDDILIFAPEYNTAFQMGSTKLNDYKIFRDNEGVYNMFRNVDIANYTEYFTGITSYNSKRYTLPESTYEIANLTFSYPVKGSYIDKNGDLIADKNTTSANIPGIISSLDGNLNSDSGGGGTIADYKEMVNNIAAKVSNSGATVYFGFCPINAKSLTTVAQTTEQQETFDSLLKGSYNFDVIGSCSNHIFAYNYFYNADSHHLTDKGRVKHTYQMYLDLSAALGITATHSATDFSGDNIAGCVW